MSDTTCRVCPKCGRLLSPNSLATECLGCWAAPTEPAGAAMSTPEALIRLIGDLSDDEPCRLDHHGYCQTHSWMDTSPCPNARALAVLATAQAVKVDQSRGLRPLAPEGTDADGIACSALPHSVTFYAGDAPDDIPDTYYSGDKGEPIFVGEWTPAQLRAVADDMDRRAAASGEADPPRGATAPLAPEGLLASCAGMSVAEIIAERDAAKASADKLAAIVKANAAGAVAYAEMDGKLDAARGLLTEAADKLEELRDEGPDGEGWKSAELKALIGKLLAAAGKAQ